MAKYKVGDKVLVRNDLVEYEVRYHMEGNSEWWYFYPNMAEFKGKVVTITTYDSEDDAYEIEEDAREDYWVDEMFEGLAEEEKPAKPTTKYKKGDKVLVRSDLIVGNRYPDMTFVNDMAAFMGKVVTIIHIEHNRWYGIDGYPHPWWTDEMFEGLAEETPTPAAPITVNLNINIDMYANSCWHCRKGGIVDLYLNGRPGICPSCGRVCNGTTIKQIEVKPYPPLKLVEKKKENKPLTKEELRELPEGSRVFTVWLINGEDAWGDDRTRWRILCDGILRWEKGSGSVGLMSSSIKVYLEEPERPKETEDDWDEIPF
jgi:hypothetical protein